MVEILVGKLYQDDVEDNSLGGFLSFIDILRLFFTWVIVGGLILLFYRVRAHAQLIFCSNPQFFILELMEPFARKGLITHI